jgi:hypothetical protein
MRTDTRKLSRDHLAELRNSGLSDDTIESSGVYSEYATGRIGSIIGWSPPITYVPALVFPFTDSTGSPTGFARIKPAKPRRNAEGKPVKYEQPQGEFARAYFTHQAIEALPSPENRIYITEGEKKALSMAEHIGPTIGLCGVWNWQAKRTEGQDRQLIPDLAAINWAGREVVVVFDCDEELKPNVELAQIELCRVLERHGAKTLIRSHDPLRQFGKGIDDVLAAEHLRAQVIELIADGDLGPIDDLSTWKTRSINQPGIYFVGSATGAGKSITDRPLIQSAESSVTCLPGHQECEEAAKRYQTEWGVDARAYPKLDNQTCLDLPLANRAMDFGLSPALTVCTSCQFRDQCDFRRLVTEAETVPHQIATHKRIEVTGGACLEGKRVVICHERVIDSMRPTIRIIRDKFDRVFAACQIVEEAMVLAESSYDGSRKSNQTRAWFAAAERTATWIRQSLAGDDHAIDKPSGMAEPPWIMGRIYTAMDAILRNRGTSDYELRPEEHFDHRGQPLSEEKLERVRSNKRASFFKYLSSVVRVCVGNASARFAKITLLDGPRRIVAERVVPLDPTQTTWLQDATTTYYSIKQLIGDPLHLPVEDVGSGRQTQIHPIYQLVMDHGTPKAFAEEPAGRKGKVGVTKGRDAESIGQFTAALIASLPTELLPVGVICHLAHKSAITSAVAAHTGLWGLDPIARIDHFHGTSTRGSNVWMDPRDGSRRCRCLIVAGTPRIPPQEIANRAAQYGWATPDQYLTKRYQTRYWLGRDSNGQIVPVSYLGYVDRHMDLAYRELVIAELRQSVGRARVCDPNGMPVIFAGNEPLRSWDWAQGEHGADTSTCVPGAMFLLTYPELIRQGLELTKNGLQVTGLKERKARDIVELVNRAAAEPGAKIGWIQDKHVQLPWQ